MDGANPSGGLVLSGSKLYGTTVAGGSSSNGTIFALNTEGTGFTNLHNFDGTRDGANPYASLILSGNTLYGTAVNGGGGGAGTVFALNPDGTAFRTLYAFSSPGIAGTNANADGAFPFADLVLSGDTLYGTANDTLVGGSGTNTNLFALTPGPGVRF